MKKVLFYRMALILSLIMIFSFFAGCGEDKKADEKKDPVSSVTTAPTAAPTEAPTEEGPTAEPTEPPTPKPTATPMKMTITEIGAFAENKPYTDGQDGWKFYGNNLPIMNFQDGHLVLEDVVSNDFLQIRLAPGENAQSYLSAETLDNTFAIGFYIENNNPEPVGVTFFGELIYEFHNSRTDEDESSAHQAVFYQAIFDDIECYLVDMEGNAVACEEFETDGNARLGDGLAYIPANFKGYYIVALDSLGGYTCYYAQWYESGQAETHRLEDCDYGRYRTGTSVANLGFSLYANEDADGSTYIIGDYVLANKAAE